MANITECNRLITLEHIKNFIEDLIQDSSGNTVSVNLGDYPLTYCPTYSQLINDTFIPFYNQSASFSLDKDGINIAGAYASNQNTLQGDLEVNFTRLDSLAIGSDKTSVDACDISTVLLSHILTYDRNVKTHGEICTGSSIVTSSSTDSSTAVNWVQDGNSGVTFFGDVVVIDPIGGTGGTRNIIISGNTEFRKSIIPSTPREITIVQSGICCDCHSFWLLGTSAAFEAKNPTPQSVSYSAGECVTVNASSNASWLSTDVIPSQQQIILTPTTNTGSSRAATVIVTSSDGECTITGGTITVIQASGCTCQNFSDLTPTAMTFSATNITAKNATYNAAECVTVSAIPNVDWLTANVDNTNKIISLLPTTNTGDARTATVTVISTDDEGDSLTGGTISVKQESGCTCHNFGNLTPTMFEFEGDETSAKTASYTAATCVTVSATTDANWLTLNVNNSSKTISIKPTLNEGSYRTAIVNVISSDNDGDSITAGTIYVSQDSNCQCNDITYGCNCEDFGSITPTSVTFGAKETGAKTVSYTADDCLSISAIPSVDWLTANVNSAAKTISLTAIENSGSSRTASVTVTSSNGSCTITSGTISVKQNSGCTCHNFDGLSTNSVSFQANSALTSTVSYTAATCVTVNASSNASWLTANVNSTAKTITLTATENSGTSRTATVTVTSSDGKCTITADTISAIQASGCSCHNFGNLNPTDIEFLPTDTTAKTVSYTADSCVSVSVSSEADWLSLNVNQNTKKISITPTANTGESRTAIVSVFSSGGSCSMLGGTIYVSQTSGCKCDGIIYECNCEDFGSVSQTRVTLNARETSGTSVSYTADDCVTVNASSNVSWLTTSANTANKTISLVPSVNSGASRTATVTVTSSDGRRTITASTITVTQNSGCTCQDFSDLNPKNITFLSTDTTPKTVTYTAGECVTANASTNVDWLSLSVSQSQKKIYITPIPNSGASRNATITVTSTDGVCTITAGTISVSQASGCTCHNFYGVSTTSVDFLSTDTAATIVSYTADSCVTVSVGATPSWLTAIVNNDNKTISIKPTANVGDTRIATINVLSSDGSCTITATTITVTQGNGCKCSDIVYACSCEDFGSITPTSLSFGASETTSKTVRYTADDCVTVSAITSVDWLTASVDKNNKTISVRPLSNSGTSRTAAVDVTSSNGTCTITGGTISVSQSSGCTCNNFGGLSKNSVTFSPTDLTPQTVTYTAAECISVSAGTTPHVSWLNVNVNNNAKTITLTPTANTGGSRTATVTVISMDDKGGSITAGTITATQTSGCTCHNFYGVSTNSVSFLPTDTTAKTVTYTADSCVSVSLGTTPSWLTASADTSTKTITLKPTANTGAARETGVIVKSSDGSCTITATTITVTQGNGCNCGDITYLCNSEDFGSLSTSAVTFSSSDTTAKTVRYTADDCVTISAGTTPHVSWLTTSVDTSTKTITLTPSENTGSSRTATVTVTSSNGKTTITGGTISVTQTSGCTCNDFYGLSSNSVVFGPDDTTATSVTYNAARCVSVSASTTPHVSWLNVNVNNNTKTISLTPTANTGGSRTATVTVISSGATCTKTGGTITVTQTSGCTCDNFGNLTPTSITFSPTDTTAKTVSYTAATCVTVGASVPSSVTWLSAQVMPGEKKIYITPTANTGASRTATVTVTSTDGTCTKTGGTITVTQTSGCTCNDFYGLSSNSVVFGPDDTTAATVTYNAAECIVASAGTTPHVSWLNVSVNNTTKKITITPTANTGGSRTATVTVISSGSTCTKTGGTITVTQTSGCTCDNFGNLTPTSFTIGPDDTSTKESSYYADSCVTVGASVPSSATWLNVVVNQNAKKILITPTANRGAERTAVITVTSTDGTCTKTGGTITVTQGNGCKCSDIVYLCNSQDFGRLSSSAEIFSSQDTTPRTVSYTADDCVTISAGTTPYVSWLATSVDTSTKTITLTPSVNTGASRTATVTVTSSNGSSTITGGTISVTQRSGCTCNNFGNLTPTSVTFDAEDIEQKVVTYTASPCVSISFSVNASWLAVSKDESLKRIILTPTVNTGASRTAIVTVISSDGTNIKTGGTITVTQGSGCTYQNFGNLSKNSISFSSNSTTPQTVTYSAGTCVTVNAYYNVNWLTTNVDEINKVITITPTVNTGASRTTTVTVTSSDGKHTMTGGTISVTQASGCTCNDFDGLSTNSVSFLPTDTTAKTVSYTAATCVNVSASTNVDWLSLNVNQNTKRISITPTANTGESRTATVSVISSGATCIITADTISVTQGDGCTCNNFGNLSPTRITFSPTTTDSKTVSYTADSCVTVNASSNVPWLTTSVNSSSKTISLTPTVNTGESRTATVTVISSSATCTKTGGTITVTQTSGCTCENFGGLSTNSVNFASGTTSSTIVRYTADECVMVGATSSDNWLIVNVDNQAKTITLAPSSVNTGASRTATVTVTSTDGTCTITGGTISVTQSGGCNCNDALTIPSSASSGVEFEYSASSSTVKQVNITKNACVRGTPTVSCNSTAFTVVISGDYVLIRPKSANNTHNEIRGEVTISYNIQDSMTTCTKSFIVKQKAKPYDCSDVIYTN